MCVCARVCTLHVAHAHRNRSRSIVKSVKWTASNHVGFIIFDPCKNRSYLPDRVSQSSSPFTLIVVGWFWIFDKINVTKKNRKYKFKKKTPLKQQIRFKESFGRNVCVLTSTAYSTARSLIIITTNQIRKKPTFNEYA